MSATFSFRRREVSERVAYNSDIVELKIKLPRSVRDGLSNVVGDSVSLSEQTFGIVSSDHSFQDFVPNGGEDAFVVVRPERLMDDWEPLFYGTKKQPQANRNHLEIPSARRRVDDLRLDSNVVHVGNLQPGEEKVQTLADRLPRHSSESVKHHGALSAVH